MCLEAHNEWLTLEFIHVCAFVTIIKDIVILKSHLVFPKDDNETGFKIHICYLTSVTSVLEKYWSSSFFFFQVLDRAADGVHKLAKKERRF